MDENAQTRRLVSSNNDDGDDQGRRRMAQIYTIDSLLCFCFGLTGIQPTSSYQLGQQTSTWYASSSSLSRIASTWTPQRSTCEREREREKHSIPIFSFLVSSPLAPLNLRPPTGRSANHNVDIPSHLQRTALIIESL